jgi:superfamily II DNA or RNA helicase
MNGFDNIPLATQPENLSKILFKHQLASIYQMETLEREKIVQYEYCVKETRLGFNADITGYGKTLSMIGLILRDKMDWDLNIPFVKEVVTTESGGLILNRKIERFDKISSTLILVPTSIISQWVKELAYTNLNVKVIESKKDIDNLIVENYDVVIVSVSMFNNLAISYPRYAWKRFIFDEPGQVRVSGMKEIIAGFYWLVTATPEDINLQHRNCRGSFMKKIIGDEWCKIEEQFDGMILKNDLNFVHASFNAPPTYHYYHKCFHSVLKTVSGIVNNNIHTMIAADNIEGAIAALGGKKTENIVELVKNDLLEKLTKIKKDIIIYRDIKKDDKKLEISTIEEVRIKKQIDQLYERFDNMLKDICSICTEKLKTPIMEPYCQNLFCGKCLLTWLEQNDKCPLCRTNIDTSDLVYLTDKEEISNVVISKEKQNTPLEKVIEILKSKKDGKFIIFSSYNETFKPICRRLKECSISFVVVVGNRKNREKSIDSFKHGETQVIFLNSNCNGAGINLQEATDIILYHKMTETTQNQIIGRANRIGRLECLNVHHLQVDI